MLFNRTPVLFTGKTIEQPPADLVKNTISLWNASIDDAIRYGGELTRAALGAMNLRGDKKYIVVDTKVHMLMKGMYPAIPGWHTDGVPRGPNKHPQAKEPPDIWAQEEMESPRFHLLVTGEGCLTDFLMGALDLDIPREPDSNLYANITKMVNKHLSSMESVMNDVYTLTIPPCMVAEWDWWNLHTAVPASFHEWRFLIRVTETDYQEPETDLRKVLRTQQNVYVPEVFGW